MKMKIPLCACVGILGALATAPALAQSYPVKPVRIVVGFVRGGGADSSARLLAQRLPEGLGQQVIVDNRPGAGGIIAGDLVAKAPADGYTLLMTSAPDAALLAVRKEMPHDIMKNLGHVSLVATGPFVLVVHPVVPARTVKEFSCACARSRASSTLRHRASAARATSPANCSTPWRRSRSCMCPIWARPRA